MNADPGESLLAEIRRSARLVERGIVTAPEFVAKVYSVFAHAEAVHATAIQPLWASVPAAILERFTASIRASANPEFQWRPFYIGPGPSEEERVEGTRRIKAWSRAMLQARDGQSKATD